MLPTGVTISVPDDDTVIDTNEAPRPRKLEVDDVGFADLREQLDKANRGREEEQRRREAAESRARQSDAAAATARREADTARTEGAEGKRSALQNAVAAKKSMLDGIEAEMTTALETGNFAKFSQLQRRMSEEAAELKTIESGLSVMGEEAKIEQRKAAAPPAEPEPTDEFEKYVRKFSPVVQDWLRQHPECVTNGTKNAQIIAAHREALDKGYAAESDAYFAYVERRMGYTQDAARRAAAMDNLDVGDAGTDEGRQDSPRRTQNVPPSARVTRSTGSRSTNVRLEPNEVTAATDGSIVWNVGNTDHLGVTISEKDPRLGQAIGEYEYARRKKLMAREGRFNIPYAE